MLNILLYVSSSCVPVAAVAQSGGQPAATSVVTDSTVNIGVKVAGDPVMVAREEYARTGVARTVEEGVSVAFPYGHAQPTLTCAPLRACVIELDAGETVLSRISGDTQRWEIALAPAGVDGRTPLVVVKPHDCGLSTNLVLTTSLGRIYDLTLDSPPCQKGGLGQATSYVRHVRFYYPDDMVRTVGSVVGSAGQNGVGVVTAGSGLRKGAVESLNFDYRLDRGKKFPWVPVAVFDDGVRCYIKLPAEALHRDAPALFALDEDGGEGRSLMNYNVENNTYVTDHVFRSAELVLGGSGADRTLRIENVGVGAGKAEAKRDDRVGNSPRVRVGGDS